MCIKSGRTTCKKVPKIGRKHKMPKSRQSCGKPGRIWSFWPLHLLSINYCPRFRWGVNRLAEGCFSNGWQLHILHYLMFPNLEPVLRKDDDSLLINSLLNLFISSSMRFISESNLLWVFFTLKDLICIRLRILLWGKLALWSNLCVLIHKWEKSSLCGMGKKIGNGPPCENSSYTFSDRNILIFKKIAKIYDLQSGLLPRLKVSVQNLEYRDPCGKRRENKSTPRGRGSQSDLTEPLNIDESA